MQVTIWAFGKMVVRKREIERKFLMKEGTIVDALIITAPPATKNASQKCDPEMHQSKQGNQGCFGMKAQIGVDAQSGLVRRVTCTAANVADIVQTHQLLHGEEPEVTADARFQGVEKREEIVAGARGVEWHIAARRDKIRSMPKGMIQELAMRLDRAKAPVQVRVERPLRVLAA